MRSSGITCSRCKKQRNEEVKTVVACTIPVKDAIIRRRKCPVCGKTTKTMES